MIVVDLDNNKYDWKYGVKDALMLDRQFSGLHVKARELVRERFPTLEILEEVPFKPRYKDRKTLYIDFYLPLRKLAIEVQGEQHFKYTPQFHPSRLDFINQMRNDREKAEWCELNAIELILLDFDKVDEWTNQLG